MRHRLHTALPLLCAILFASLTSLSEAQWQLQDAHTTADLRGIDALGNGVAWASGTNGTILRTEDAGFVWQLCAIPPGADKLDFRGIQAFDNNTAIVMSSGKGDLSRLYKTTDGCQTWKLLFTNPDKDGFWDALRMYSANSGWLLGDPVRGQFALATFTASNPVPLFIAPSANGMETNESGPLKTDDAGAFAASNSSLLLASHELPPEPQKPFGKPCQSVILWFGTGGPGMPKVYRLEEDMPQCSDYGTRNWKVVTVPVGHAAASAGVFSLAAATRRQLVAVGGDYTAAQEYHQTAAYSQDGGITWLPAQVMPRGYRSAVAYDKPHNTWITVGPNGTDISTDDGRNWRALKPFADEPTDNDQHWNALSLPFVVGPHGRIGVLRPEALRPAKKPVREMR